MAPTVQARIGDSVRANFNLVYKNVEVAKLHDKEDYWDYGFEMIVRRKGPGDGSGQSYLRKQTDGPCRCKNQGPIGDDEPIEVVFVFEDQKTFQIDDIWELYFVYLHDNPMEERRDPKWVFPPHPRVHLLGRVQLVS